MSNYLSTVGDALLNGMGTNLFAKSANLISGIAPLFAAGFGIYLLLIIVNYYNRGFDENIVDFSKKIISWFIIIACAFNAEQYNKLANLMYEMPEAISSLFGNSNYSSSAMDTNFDMLIDTVNKALDYANSLTLLSASAIAERIGAYIFAVLIICLGGLFFAATFAFYLVAKLSLAMVILVGPLFIGALLFPGTKQWGMNWIGQIFNYSITIVFYVILGSLQQDYFERHLMSMFNGPVNSLAMLILMVFVFSVSTMIFLIVAWGIPSIASALTGGASLGGMPRTMMSVGRYIKLPSFRGSSGGSIGKG